MPVNTTHPTYSQFIDQWTDCRDAAEGSRAIKLRGEKHLPKLSAQTPEEYTAYKTRALWFGATGRTVQGLLGSIFRKPMQVEAPDAMTTHLEDVTLTGLSVEAFCKTAVAEILKVGRYGILVDLGKDAAEGERPYWIGYQAHCVTNWRTSQQDCDTVLTQVVLQDEACEPDPTDPFTDIRTPQYRVLKLEDKRYVVELWREDTHNKGKWTLYQTINPTFRGAPLSYIPFCFLGPSAITPDPEKPPLLDLVDVNLSHYRSSADLEHGRHFCGLPTPWVAGFPTETVLRIGASIAWVASDPQAKVGMLEFTGQGLGALERALDDKQAVMAILGARMLEAQKKAVESSDTHEIRQAGESSSLQSIAGTVEDGLTRVMTWHAEWMGLSESTVSLTLNKVFLQSRMAATDLAELMKAWQAGGISYETLYWNLERGELTRPDVTMEEEQRLIDTQQPARLPLQDSLPGVPLS